MSEEVPIENTMLSPIYFGKKKRIIYDETGKWGIMSKLQVKKLFGWRTIAKTSFESILDYTDGKKLIYMSWLSRI